MFHPDAIAEFRYLGYELDAARRELRCRYALDDQVEFCERITFDVDGDWSSPSVVEAARLVFLLAGVSYYKAAAPRRIDVGTTPLRAGERTFLRTFYLDGLGEYAYRNGLDLTGVEVLGGVEPGPAVSWPARAADDVRALIPFGGGIDSIVTVEALRDRFDDVALFVQSRQGLRFTAIEAAAAAAGLPVLRADQKLDAQILRSDELGFRNGHVPVTGVLSAVALLVAALDGRDAVIMSNEWSASAGNVSVGGRTVNHQYSKSWQFERDLREVLVAAFAPAPAYFSFLRPYSELWVARQFAQLVRYHSVFRSCNRAFHVDPAMRLAAWCGRCDKCCFIDLILAPFLSAARLADVFAGHEPLADPALAPRFRSLLATSAAPKPFECVGDVDECRVAAVLAAQREDRAATPLLHQLVAELGDEAPRVPAAADRLLAPLGPTHAPDAPTPRDSLV